MFCTQVHVCHHAYRRRRIYIAISKSAHRCTSVTMRRETYLPLDANQATSVQHHLQSNLKTQVRWKTSDNPWTLSWGAATATKPAPWSTVGQFVICLLHHILL